MVDKLLRVILFLALLLPLAACEKVELNDDKENGSGASSTPHNLVVNISLPESFSIPYPLSVFIIDDEGKVKAENKISDASSTSVTFKLERGNYKAFIVPSYDDCIVTRDNGNVAITMTGNGYSQSPVVTGTGNIIMSEYDSSIKVQLKNIVANLRVALKNIPDVVNDVTVSFSECATSMTSSNLCVDPKTIEVPCRKTDGVWTINDLYVMPSVSSKVIMTINMMSADDRKVSHQYVLKQHIVSNTPYTFSGDYMSIPGEDIFGDADNDENWNEIVDEDFTFGPGAQPTIPDDSPEGSETGNTDNTENGDTSSDTNGDVVVSPDFPSEGEIWDGHVVAFTQDVSANERYVTLISLVSWVDVYSAYHAKHPDDASTRANEYSEGGLKGWRIPTYDESETLIDLYRLEYNLSLLNEAIVALNGTRFIATDAGGNNARYLCDDARKSFTLSKTSYTQKAGATTRYRLKLVKTLIFRR